MYHTNDDSEATLAYIPQTLSYIFSRDSATNTFLSCRDSQYGYSVSTSAKTGKTSVSRTDTQEEIASIDMRIMLPDLVSFPARCGSKPVRIRSWLGGVDGKTRAKYAGNDQRAISTMQTSGGRNCMWVSSEWFRLALIPEGSEEPIAYIGHTKAPSPPELVVSTRHADIIDEIAVAAIILEQKVRLREQSEWMTMEGGDGYQYALCALALG